jgi:hypothetical protein
MALNFPDGPSVNDTYDPVADVFVAPPEPDLETPAEEQ